MTCDVSCDAMMSYPVLSCPMLSNDTNGRSIIIPVSANKHSFYSSRGLVRQQQKLLSSPLSGAFQANTSTCLLLRRSVFSQTLLITTTTTNNHNNNNNSNGYYYCCYYYY